MALTQTQIIRALADALNWFEKELAWGVSPASLGHLTGRIGELYAAMITRGQMALAVNQQGYDVVSAEGEHISVKTVTTATHVSFNASTLDIVDRVIVLRIQVDEGEVSIEEILDQDRSAAMERMRPGPGRFDLSIAPRRRARSLLDLKVVDSATYGIYFVKQFENGTIIVETNGTVEPAAMPVLRSIAATIAVDLLNANGNPKNTRTLGSDVIRSLHALGDPRGAAPGEGGGDDPTAV